MQLLKKLCEYWQNLKNLQNFDKKVNFQEKRKNDFFLKSVLPLQSRSLHLISIITFKNKISRNACHKYKNKSTKGFHDNNVGNLRTLLWGLSAFRLRNSTYWPSTDDWMTKLVISIITSWELFLKEEKQFYC